MAVLEHVHPDSLIVFDEMCWRANQILAIEPIAGHSSERQHPHDLWQLFTDRGMTLVSVDYLGEDRWQPLDLPDYAAWRFVR